MASFRKFEEIESWKMARVLTQMVYQASARGEFARDFAMRDQVCRASLSIMANIAEGFERNGNREFIQFLSVAKGSAGEVRSFLYVAHDLGYITHVDFEELRSSCRSIAAAIQGLADYLRSSDCVGSKFAAPQHGPNNP